MGQEHMAPSVYQGLRESRLTRAVVACVASNQLVEVMEAQSAFHAQTYKGALLARCAMGPKQCFPSHGCPLLQFTSLSVVALFL